MTRLPDDPPPPARESSTIPAGRRRVETSAGGVVVRPVEDEYRVLVIRDPYHKWGLPKGHLEGSESPEQAAIREVREEAGLHELVLGPDLGEIDWTFRAQGTTIHKFCRFFLMASFEGSTQPQVEEGISECVWLSPEEAVQQVAYQNAREIIERGVALLVASPGPGVIPWEER